MPTPRVFLREPKSLLQANITIDHRSQITEEKEKKKKKRENSRGKKEKKKEKKKKGRRGGWGVVVANACSPVLRPVLLHCPGCISRSTCVILK